ncbi:hypothetical protein PMAYCL1PPCAC_10728, partial [Pristionchus mayeri]
MEFEPAFNGNFVPVIGDVRWPFHQKDGKYRIAQFRNNKKNCRNGSTHCVKDSSLCNGLGVIDGGVYVARNDNASLSIVKLFFGEDGTYRKEVIQTFSESDKVVFCSNCTHYFMQSKEKVDAIIAFSITDHFNVVDGTPFLLDIGEVAQMVAVQKNCLYEIRTVNGSKEIWRRTSLSDQIEKIYINTNWELDRLFCLGGAVIVSDAIQLRVYEVDKFDAVKIISFPGERHTSLFVVSIYPEGEVLAFTKQIDLNVKAVKSLYFHKGRLPEGVA